MTRAEALRILGLEPDATPTEVKQTYRQLVKAVHPDKNPAPNARHLFQLVQEAYESISTTEEQAKEELRKWEQQREHASVGLSGVLFFPGVILFSALCGGAPAAPDFFGFDLSWLHFPLIPISVVISLCKVNAWSMKYQLRRFYRNHPPPSEAGRDTQHAIPVTSFGEGFSVFFVALLIALEVFIMIDATVENRADLMDMESSAVALAVITPIAEIGFAVIVLYDIVNWLKINL